MVVSRQNLLYNASFEENELGNCVWYDENGKHTDCPQEVRPPNHWTAWWFNQWPNVCYPHKTGQIELSRFNTDPFRIIHGNWSLKYFTFFRCHWAGILQQVELPSGTYSASVKAQAWYSSCSSKPYAKGNPLDENCNPAPWANLTIRIGIGTGDDPRQNVVWSLPVEGYNEWVTAQTPPVFIGGLVTVFIESRSDAPLKHNDVYLDDVWLK